MHHPDSNKPVSPQKVAANRSNAKRSTGPTTEAGKAKAAQNSYKHGFFASRLYPNDELRVQDGAHYDMILNGLVLHYEPVGFMECFWLEKIATEALRIARVLGYGQEVLQWQAPFERRSMDKLLRYESTVNRNFANAVKNLELLQAQRKAESSQLDEPTDPEPDPVAAEPQPTPREPTSTLEEPVAQEPPSVSPTEDVSQVHPTAEDENAAAGETTEPTPPTEAKPPQQPTETVPSPTPPNEDCTTKSTSSSHSMKELEDDIADIVDNAEYAPMETEAPQQTAESVPSPMPPKTYEENPEFSNRWIETPEDRKLNEELYFEAFGYLPY